MADDAYDLQALPCAFGSGRRAPSNLGDRSRNHAQWRDGHVMGYTETWVSDGRRRHRPPPAVGLASAPVSASAQESVSEWASDSASVSAEGVGAGVDGPKAQP